MTRERARSERRDVDLERGEPLAGGAARGRPRSLRTPSRPVPEYTSRPRILVTNDDGVESRGLLALKQALEPIGDVTVVAPDTNQSAVGHTKTLMRPLRVRERTLADGSLAYSVDGSPTDAVSLAFLGYFDHGFDLVAAGINYGANLGDDITYSGTVSAAMEAVINNCPAFAISQEYYEHPDFTLAGYAATVVARNILAEGLSRGELVNVNVPAATLEDCEGIEVTRLGRRVYSDELLERRDPRGIPYFWIGGPPPSGLSVPGTDFHAVVNRRHRGHPDPPRPHRTSPPAAAQDVELGPARVHGPGGTGDPGRRRADRPGRSATGRVARRAAALMAETPVGSAVRAAATSARRRPSRRPRSRRPPR